MLALVLLLSLPRLEPETLTWARDFSTGCLEITPIERGGLLMAHSADPRRSEGDLKIAVSGTLDLDTRGSTYPTVPAGTLRLQTGRPFRILGEVEVPAGETVVIENP